jgi:hypothetical protein
VYFLCSNFVLMIYVLLAVAYSLISLPLLLDYLCKDYFPVTELYASSNQILIGFGGVLVIMLAFGTQVHGFKHGRNRRILGQKNSSACLPSEGK